MAVTPCTVIYRGTCLLLYCAKQLLLGHENTLMPPYFPTEVFSSRVLELPHFFPGYRCYSGERKHSPSRNITDASPWILQNLLRIWYASQMKYKRSTSAPTYSWDWGYHAAQLLLMMRYIFFWAFLHAVGWVMMWRLACKSISLQIGTCSIFPVSTPHLFSSQQ